MASTGERQTKRVSRVSEIGIKINLHWLKDDISNYIWSYNAVTGLTE